MWYICTWRLLSFIMDCSVCLVALFASIGSSNGMVDCIDFRDIEIARRIVSHQLMNWSSCIVRSKREVNNRSGRMRRLPYLGCSTSVYIIRAP